MLFRSEVLAHDIGVGGAAIEIINRIDELILPNRFVGEYKILFVDEDEIDVAVAVTREFSENIQLVLPDGSIGGDDSKIEIALWTSIPRRSRSEHVHRPYAGIAPEDLIEVPEFR